jgi:hypothetical protein
MRRRHLRALASAAFGGLVQTKVHFSTSNKVIVGASALISAIHTTDFIFYGQEIRNLLGAAGFAMLAYGTLRSENQFAHITRWSLNNYLRRCLAATGLVLIMASYLFKWLG